MIKYNTLLTIASIGFIVAIHAALIFYPITTVLVSILGFMLLEKKDNPHKTLKSIVWRTLQDYYQGVKMIFSALKLAFYVLYCIVLGFLSRFKNYVRSCFSTKPRNNSPKTSESFSKKQARAETSSQLVSEKVVKLDSLLPDFDAFKAKIRKCSVEGADSELSFKIYLVVDTYHSTKVTVGQAAADQFLASLEGLEDFSGIFDKVREKCLNPDPDSHVLTQEFKDNVLRDYQMAISLSQDKEGQNLDL